MKVLFVFKLAVFISAFPLMFGCQKESLHSSDLATQNVARNAKVNKANALQEHKLKGKYTAGYYTFLPGAGYVAPNPAPGWYPGTATVGQINLLGKSKAFVNMYASFGPYGLQGIPASLNLYAPFVNELNQLGIAVPEAVAIILFDKHGNSIWARGKGIIPLTPVSATQVTFSGESEILGGTGKFANASGSYNFSGYFNPQDTKDVGLKVHEGTIIY